MQKVIGKKVLLRRRQKRRANNETLTCKSPNSISWTTLRLLVRKTNAGTNQRTKAFNFPLGLQAFVYLPHGACSQGLPNKFLASQTFCPGPPDVGCWHGPAKFRACFSAEQIRICENLWKKSGCCIYNFFVQLQAAFLESPIIIKFFTTTQNIQRSLIFPPKWHFRSSCLKRVYSSSSSLLKFVSSAWTFPHKNSKNCHLQEKHRTFKLIYYLNKSFCSFVAPLWGERGRFLHEFHLRFCRQRRSESLCLLPFSAFSYPETAKATEKSQQRISEVASRSS